MNFIKKSVMFFTVLVTMSCSVCCASQLERVEALVSKAVLKNSDGYFILSDGSFWKVITFVKRSRTLSEWWNSASLIPEQYECVPNDWFSGAEIQVFSKANHLEVDLANASNEKALKQCTHLLYNSKNGQILFAISMQPSEFIDTLFKDARKEGYNAGYSDGRYQSTNDARASYNKGRDEGYKSGYQAGFQDAVKGTQQADTLTSN